MKDKVLGILKKDRRIWDESSQVLNRNYLLKLIDDTDEDLIKALFEDEDTKSTFFIEFDNNYVFKVKDFKLFIENNKIFNSYTSYSNRIGLSDGKQYLIDSDKVVINFPFKDCILEGGQRKEESEDYYYEYDETLTQTEKKQGYEEGKYNKKKSKRDEIFYNEILARNEIDRLLDDKVFVNWKRYTKDGVKKVGSLNRNKKGIISENLILKGNNLIGLNSLLSQFEKQVKLIYIDIPFNTGNDSFEYNDKFNHSTWLTFMKNRLEISKKLLRSDGIIFIHCDDNEQAYLKVLLDEIYGRENFISSISVLSSTPSGLKTAHRDKTIIKIKDHILVYKNGDIELNPQYTIVDKWDTHFNYYFDKENNKVVPLKEIIVEKGIYSSETSQKDYSLEDENFLKFVLKYADNIFQTGKSMPENIRKISLSPENKDLPVKYNTGDQDQYAYNGRRMSFLSNSVNEILINNKKEKMISKLVCDFWDDIDFNNSQNEGGISFPSGKKPEKLLHRIIDMTTNEGDIILDFFLGSGTTAAVGHKMKRQYIGIEQMDYIEDIAIQRMENVLAGEQGGISKALEWDGSGEFVYFQLADWNEEAKRMILNSKNYEELKGLFSKLNEDYFLDYNLNINKFINETIEEENFLKLSLKEQKEIFLNMLDLNQLYVSKSEMEDDKFGISDEDIRLTKEFYEGGE